MDAREWVESIKVVRVVGVPNVEHAGSKSDAVGKPKSGSDVSGLVASCRPFIARYRNPLLRSNSSRDTFSVKDTTGCLLYTSDAADE